MELPFEMPGLPVTKKQWKQLAHPIRQEEKRKIANGDEFRTHLKRVARDLDWTWRKQPDELVEAVRELSWQCALYVEMDELERLSDEEGWLSFIRQRPPYTKEGLDDLWSEYHVFQLQKRIEKLAAKSHERFKWMPDKPEEIDFHSAERFFFHVERQMGYYDGLEERIQSLPAKERDDYSFPKAPLTLVTLKQANDVIDHRLSELAALKEKWRRIFSLMRFGFLLMLTVASTTWQISLWREAADLHLRSAVIGIEVEHRSFPFLPWDVEELRIEVETQEQLSPYVDALRQKAASQGLQLKLEKPYQPENVELWKKALETFHFSKVPKGSFRMGAHAHSGDRDESPQHKVYIKNDYFIQTTEVSQALYSVAMKKRPSSALTCGPTCPVDNVSWYDAVRFANRISELANLEKCYQREGGVRWVEKQKCVGYRLPTEAEWEYAASGLGKQKGLRFSGSMEPAEVGWNLQNSEGSYRPVAKLKPNDLGLYDMTGNVWEWVWDWYGPYSPRIQVDPIGPMEGTERIRRGGSFELDARKSYVIRRSSLSPLTREEGVGLRLVRTDPRSFK